MEGGHQRLDRADVVADVACVATDILVAALLALIAIGTAHTAGAGYVLAHQSGKSSRWAIVRTVAALALMALAVNIAR